MKHFNSANVWGRIHSMTRKTTENGKPYVELAVNCESSAYGNVRAFGYLWGEDAVAAFMKAFRPKATVHLRGAFAQYKGRHEAIKTSFTFWKAAPWDPATGKHKAPRAAFILVGECMAYEEGGDDGRLVMRLTKENKDGSEAGEDVFELAVSADALLTLGGLPEPGRTYQVKGALAQEEDEFGEMVKLCRPVAMAIEERATGEGVPF
ncbi:MAG: hypothetical protein ACE5GY_10980 [Thermodesulfobacteriota bacterium]